MEESHGCAVSIRSAATIPVLLACALLVVGPGSTAFATGSFTESTYATGLTAPTAMAFAPDGRLFVAEQGGALRVIKNGTLLGAPFLTVPADSTGERGLLGVTIDPNFATNRFVYVYYTFNSTPLRNRVSRFTASASNPDAAQSGSEKVILDNIPSESGYHNGGGIHFGLDGKLVIGVGENHVWGNAQNDTVLAGKILRINADGSIPSDNPGFSRGEIWALGFRNPFTFGVDPVSGKIHINDVGQNTWEEIDVLQKSGNYGWPECEGKHLKDSATALCTNAQYVNPVHEYEHTGGRAAITGGEFYRGSQFPSSYYGSYFFSDYSGGIIWRLTPEGRVFDFWPNAASPVDLDVGPDGALYYLSIMDGAVNKILYSRPASVVVSSPKPFASLSGGTVTVTYQTVGDPAAVGGDHVHLQLDNGPLHHPLPFSGSDVFTNVPPGPHTLFASLAIVAHEPIPETEIAIPFVMNTGDGKKGDLSGDGVVNVIDLGILLSAWGRTDRPPADINQDGRVDVVDLGILLSNWG